ncbi:hypothetical protein [Paracoccus tegillarcae]|uniref:D-galactarate dehydratase n=1 Tax=Paracoccus tegillarcae TaxID=1529068 RepID=A0A2K9EYW3_9RHOB|nr:hypothetical protein [Paracoccus tegillarcae]AUH34504.1 hypothetical protein CUV01_14920 [Paracoccus tegillarcae]
MTLFGKTMMLVPAAALAACTGMHEGAKRPEGDPQQVAAAATAGPPPTPEEVSAAAAITQAPAPRPRARSTAAQLDTTTAAQKVAAAAPAAKAETKLGTTIASLGDVAEPGFWIKTPLVKSRGIGRIVNPANGKSSKVDLIPLDGPASGGSQLSLPALQLLGISLTDLPEIEVYRS